MNVGSMGLGRTGGNAGERLRRAGDETLAGRSIGVTDAGVSAGAWRLDNGHATLLSNDDTLSALRGYAEDFGEGRRPVTAGIRPASAEAGTTSQGADVHAAQGGQGGEGQDTTTERRD